MITIKLIGGLGNQMFQYALYIAMQKKGIDVCLDAQSFFKNDDRIHLAYHLDIFGVKYREMPTNVYPSFILNDKSLIHRILRRIRIYPGLYIEKETSKYDPNVFKLRGNKYLEGYWQTSKYFEDSLEEVKKAFTYKGEWSENNSEFRDKMQGAESVCVHIRRGDYLKLPQYINICSKDYYQKAVQYIMNKISNPKFFVFTNDIEWSKQFFSDSNVEPVFVMGNDGLSSYMDMILMTYCKHHIIANSSFSWWGSVLSKDTTGITIAPSKWDNFTPTPDIWRDNWILL